MAIKNKINIQKSCYSCSKNIFTIPLVVNKTNKSNKKPSFNRIVKFSNY